MPSVLMLRSCSAFSYSLITMMRQPHFIHSRAALNRRSPLVLSLVPLVLTIGQWLKSSVVRRAKGSYSDKSSGFFLEVHHRACDELAVRSPTALGLCTRSLLKKRLPASRRKPISGSVWVVRRNGERTWWEFLTMWQ